MKVLLLIFLLLALKSNAQILNGGSRSSALGDASITLNDVWAFQNNPAALADIRHFEIGVAYQNRFLLADLNYQSLACAIPIKKGTVSFGGNVEGFSEYRAYKAGVGYSMQLSEKFYAGVQVNYLGIQLPSVYGSTHNVSGDLGLYVKITKNWKMGAVVQNLTRTKKSEFRDERFRTLFKLGSSLIFSDIVTVHVELEKDLNNPIRVKGGVEYEPINHFFIRGGIKSGPIEGAFGFGYHFKQIKIGLGTTFIQRIGWSPNLSISFCGK